MDIRVPLNNTLRSNSQNYFSNVDNFIRFNEAHDPQDKIKKYLLPRLEGKTVLDLGCGYGKFIKQFEGYVTQYFGVDNSSVMVRRARKVKRRKSTKICLCDARKMPLKDNSVDVVFSIYGAISVVKPLSKKAKILKEVNRVLKPEGSFYLITDDFSGEWVEMKKRTKSRWGFMWLLDNDFEVVEKIKTRFEFVSFEEAFKVLHSMFGRMLTKNLKHRIIKHNIVVLERIKGKWE